MKDRRRTIVSFGLAVLVALTAIHAGAVRGQAKAAGVIVLCSGTGPVSVAVDAQGQPVGAVHQCPDCVMHLLAAVQTPAPLPRMVARAVKVDAPPAAPMAQGRPPAAYRARGPPLSV